MACLTHASGMAAVLALHVRSLPDYDRQLHVLYLTNDILLKRSAETKVSFQLQACLAEPHHKYCMTQGCMASMKLSKSVTGVCHVLHMPCWHRLCFRRKILHTQEHTFQSSQVAGQATSQALAQKLSGERQTNDATRNNKAGCTKSAVGLEFSVSPRVLP